MTYTCTGCGEKKTEVIHATGHKFGDYEVTKEATCEAEGEQTRKCSDCGKTETKPISKTNHDYETKTVTVKEAYDEQVPYSVWICGGCNAEFSSSDALDEHIWAAIDGKIPGHPEQYSDKVDTRYKTVHHDAETREEYVCKKCGHVKED